MLTKTRFRFPEILFGMLLAVAIFALGAGFESSRHPTAETPPNSNAENQKQPEGYWSATWDWLTHDATGAFTGFLVIVGAVQIGVFLRQLRLIRESLRPAEDAAKAAVDSAQTAEKSFIASRRPWIGIDNISPIPLKIGAEPDVLLAVKNFGPGPAIQMKAKVQGGIRLKAQRTPDPPTDVTDPDAGVAIVMPTSPYRYRPFKNYPVLTQEQGDGLIAKTHIAWIIGIIKYEGGMGDKHETTFRLEYFFPHGWEATETGNRAT
jgi:hypothetical protein